MSANGEPQAELDQAFSSAGVAPTPWAEARELVDRSEVFWLSTVRPDGRPHVTPLIAAGFKATLPKGKNLEPRPEGENEVILGIDQSGRYFLNGRPLPDGTLEDQLRSTFSARTEDKILYFKADNQLKYSKIQEAVETARRSGVRVMAAITEPRNSGLFEGDEKEKK